MVLVNNDRPVNKMNTQGKVASNSCVGWASRDLSGVLSPYEFCRRHQTVGVEVEVGANVNGIKVGNHLGVGTYVNSC
ncbi:hypothetical protein RJ641_015035 [Dillenia turbinata]|uniref:Uncharacterized protein n=1 Tax=Dillenia turbinata TaxID=194707 RepID=A0AAN8V5I2_9MAGN